ncbi:MAG TPA: zinc-ribbon domain-containing protein [Methanobacterium subterraneum]|uniref:Zinc-ribbon domain-containing protein n=1 Tax=Methanobacterium subterraneum TaxID=59277 RepID=A0A7J4TJG9_9EURY|nr:zinc-ribbon domain-containing protein [Methanobacterium subterraneum]
MVSSEEIRKRLEAKKRGETFSNANKTPPTDVSANKCPQCQTPNPPTAKFCVGCGAPLTIQSTPVTETKTTPPVETVTTPTTTPAQDYKLCPSCNQNNKLDAKFCIICGHKFEDETPGEKPLEPLTEVVGERETPVTQSGTVIPPTQDTADEQAATIVETPEEKTSEGNIPEIKVPEKFESDEVKSAEEETNDEVQTIEKSAPSEVTKEERTSAQISDEEVSLDEDPVLKIKKAKELLDIGAITQEEFDRIKNKYLEMI